MSRVLSIADKVVLLLSMIPYLREHGPVTVTELAEQFHAPEHTVRELVTFLGTAGIPGETHTYQPEDLFDIDWDAFELNDVVSLTHIVAVDHTPRFAPAEYAALLAGLHALSELLPRAEAEVARSAAIKLGLAAPKTDSEAPVLTMTAERSDPRLTLAAQAIAEGRRLRFAYVDLRGSVTEREIEPGELTQQGDDWYVRGYCLTRNDERTFLVASMRDTALGETMHAARERKGHDRAATESRPADDSATLVRTRVRERSLHRFAGFSPRVVAREIEGWVSVEVQLAFAQSAIRLVQLAPGDIVIESPVAARSAVREWIDRALAHSSLGETELSEGAARL